MKESLATALEPAATSSPQILLRLFRVKQWTKNLLVLAAFLFTYGSAESGSFLRAVAAFAAMCLVSSATYIVNDWRDAEKDRAHPKKRLRPLASGVVSVPAAFTAATVSLFLGIGGAVWLGKEASAIVACYLLLQIAYNLYLRTVPIADVYVIAGGFVLRAALGAAAIHVTISGWLLFCTGALALLLGFGKRRNEFLAQGEAAAASRDSLIHYNAAALDALVIISACSAAMCYGIYSLQSATAVKYPSLILTAPFVFYGITRYVLRVFTTGAGGEPEDMLFKDRHILISIILFLLTAALCVSGFQLPLLEK